MVDDPLFQARNDYDHYDHSDLAGLTIAILIGAAILTALILALIQW